MIIKDKDLTTDQIPSRIDSIDRQIGKLESVWNPRDYDKHHQKIVSLIERKEKLMYRLKQESVDNVMDVWLW